jgi:dolichol kinase
MEKLQEGSLGLQEAVLARHHVFGLLNVLLVRCISRRHSHRLAHTHTHTHTHTHIHIHIHTYTPPPHRDRDTILAMSRSGRKEELLKGPLSYGVIFVLCTVLYWKHNPIGVVALMVLCAGDGFADLAGRRFGGRYRLPHNRAKVYRGDVYSSLVLHD